MGGRDGERGADECGREWTEAAGGDEEGAGGGGAAGGGGFRTMGEPMPVEWRVKGRLAPNEAVVRPKTMGEEEGRAKDPKGAEIPEGAEKQEQSAGAEEKATGSRE